MYAPVASVIVVAAVVWNGSSVVPSTGSAVTTRPSTLRPGTWVETVPEMLPATSSTTTRSVGWKETPEIPAGVPGLPWRT